MIIHDTPKQLDEGKANPDFKKAGLEIEKVRKKMDATSEEALLLGLFRDIAFKMSKGQNLDLRIRELENTAKMGKFE